MSRKKKKHKDRDVTGQENEDRDAIEQDPKNQDADEQEVDEQEAEKAADSEDQDADEQEVEEVTGDQESAETVDEEDAVANNEAAAEDEDAPEEEAITEPEAKTSAARRARRTHYRGQHFRTKPAAHSRKRKSVRETAVARAKKVKGKPSKRMLVIAGVVVVVLIAAGVLGVNAFRDFNEKNAARNNLEAAVEKTGKVDETLALMDESINSKNTTETVQVNETLQTKLDDSKTELASLKDEIDTIKPTLRKDDLPLADAMEDAIDGREQMIDIGEEIISLDTSASIAFSLINDGWDKLLQTHEKSDAATTSANRETKGGFEESLKINNEVKTELDSVKQDFAKVKELFPTADLGAFDAYLAGRINANSLAIASDQALIAGNTKAANEAITKLNAQNVASAKEIQGLKNTPEAAVQNAYEALASPLLEEYANAKKSTAEIDDKIRSMRQ